MAGRLQLAPNGIEEVAIVVERAALVEELQATEGRGGKASFVLLRFSNSSFERRVFGKHSLRHRRDSVRLHVFYAL